MSQKFAILSFPKSMIEKPVISRVIRDCDVEVNILQAKITPEEDGRMFVIFKGVQGAVDQSLSYLRDNGVLVILPSQNLIWDESRCVSCSSCVGQCISNAFSVDPETHRVTYDSERCIACELCIPACFYKAIESVGDHFKKNGAVQ